MELEARASATSDSERTCVWDGATRMMTWSWTSVWHKRVRDRSQGVGQAVRVSAGLLEHAAGPNYDLDRATLAHNQYIYPDRDLLTSGQSHLIGDQAVIRCHLGGVDHGLPHHTAPSGEGEHPGGVGCR